MNFFKKKFSQEKMRIKGEDKSKREFYPARDWRVIVIFFSLLLFGVFLASYFLFFELISLEEVTATESAVETVRVVDQNLIRQAIDQVAAKETALEAMRQTPPTIIDPSR